VIVAALYDIHGNLPALEAVLAEVDDAHVDLVVVGGDVLPGPMPRETLATLLALDVPVRFIYGNGELAVLAQIEASDPSDAKYWGTTSGAPLPDAVKQATRWTAQQVQPAYDDEIRRWPKTQQLEIGGLGRVLFCHGTPRSETECFTRLTPEDRLLPLFQGLGVSLVVCGHTHMPFDRTIGGVRVVNAGSIGAPFGPPGADWALIGPDVELRHTPYDLERAAARVRATAYPQADAFAAQSILQPPSEAAMLDLFTNVSFR
jgi:predicted phosphodiesterase